MIKYARTSDTSRSCPHLYIIVFMALFLSMNGEGARAQKIRHTDTSNQWRTVAESSTDYPIRNYTYTNFKYRDTVVHHGDHEYRLLNDNMLVREDTTEGKVYIRSLTGSMPEVSIGISDTGEFLFYDYQMAVGDTLTLPYSYYGGYSSVHVLDSTGTVLINNEPHIWQRFTIVSGFSNSHLSSYTVVEGIGTERGPFHRMPDVNFEVSFSLHCFSHKGRRPDYPTDDGVWHAEPWRNWIPSCDAASVRETKKDAPSIRCYPNPAHEAVHIALHNTAGSSLQLHIFDALGRKVYAAGIKETIQVDVSGWQRGLYLCSIADEQGRKSIQKIFIR